MEFEVGRALAVHAWNSPRTDCGHRSELAQQCGTCGRWCCISCYSPWMALTCTACRMAAEALAPVLMVAEDMDDMPCPRPERPERCRNPVYRQRRLRSLPG